MMEKQFSRKAMQYQAFSGARTQISNRSKQWQQSWPAKDKIGFSTTNSEAKLENVNIGDRQVGVAIQKGIANVKLKRPIKLSC